MNTKPKPLSEIPPDRVPSPGQLRCIRAFKKFKAKHGRVPTQRELSAAMGLSENGAATHISECVKKGFFTQPKRIVLIDLTPEGERWA